MLLRFDFRRGAAAALALGVLACPAAAPLPEPAAPPPPPPAPQDFSVERAWQHRLALDGLGPRPPGSQASARARGYLENALREDGIEVAYQRAESSVNVLAAIAGASSDQIVLVARYDTDPGAEDAAASGGASGAAESASGGASGAALLLELGRALAVRGLEYSVLLAFVEGDALALGASSGAVPPETVGTGALVAQLAAEGSLDRIRLAVHFDRVEGTDLRIARDLLSSRALREEFWTAARRLGHTQVFPPTAPFESVGEGRRAFLAAGLRRSVAITGSRLPVDEPEAASEAAPAADAPAVARAKLGVVGEVSLDAIVTISQRLAKIDRFVQSPLASEPAVSAPPAPPESVVDAEAPDPEVAAP